MCIGIPMKVIQVINPSAALCEGEKEKGGVNTMLVGDVEPGEWVLVWNGMAVQKITEDRAQKVKSALGALETAASGESSKESIDDAFSDIVSQTGQLPPHLAALVKKG